MVERLPTIGEVFFKTTEPVNLSVKAIAEEPGDKLSGHDYDPHQPVDSVKEDERRHKSGGSSAQ